MPGKPMSAYPQPWQNRWQAEVLAGAFMSRVLLKPLLRMQFNKHHRQIFPAAASK